MLHLRLSAGERLAEKLRGVRGVRRVTLQDGVVSADVDEEAADAVVALLAFHEVPDDDYVIAHLDVVAPRATLQRGTRSQSGPAWVEVLGEARANARPVGRYLTLMGVAGILAALGVLDKNVILVIGAMAVSPDLLPICAICVGIVGARVRLVWRASLTLAIGLALGTVVAALVTWLLKLADWLPDDFVLNRGALGTLATVDIFTILVALAAGVAGVLAFQTRASAAVGVAISVTTIPASAYLGVGIGLGEGHKAVGALAVLGVNVGCIIASGTVTLLIQRYAAHVRERRHEHAAAARSSSDGERRA
ncbi:DUF389 domain-containing protein [Conexibacter sp. CPCC 206217]|uniref:DUF389 domain-containing protein n=1 Tax=Conexibacter sp. CPCC 206217 TaxID=3064574 RepID=UPI00271B3906|nr:DUF389 domain-containing protein [Conexibacter sp. CPCC 206217]MDO8209304.1 DUF389 domain-containing protein [Conexibacter sp. CPCC 206217]